MSDSDSKSSSVANETQNKTQDEAWMEKERSRLIRESSVVCSIISDHEKDSEFHLGQARDWGMKLSKLHERLDALKY